MIDISELEPSYRSIEEPTVERGPSDILFYAERDGAWFTVYEMKWQGGDADFEDEAGVLDYALERMLDADTQEGWHVCEGFTVEYTRDWLGDVDATHKCGVIRRATSEEIIKGVALKQSWEII